MRVVELLAMIEDMIRSAAAGKPVVLFDMITLIRKDRSYAHALIRILLMVITMKGITADDVARMRIQLKAASEQRQRPTRLPRQPGERLSPKLW